MTIHPDNPFTDPVPDQVRRFRARLGGRVSLWTSGAGRERAALTVSSFMVGTGEPGVVVGLLDPDTDLAERLADTGRAVVHLLDWRHRDLAEQAAGLMPAPGGVFAQAAFEDSDHGPFLPDVGVRASVRLTGTTPPESDAGWSWLVTCTIDALVIGDEEDPLHHRRGRYER